MDMSNDKNRGTREPLKSSLFIFENLNLCSSYTKQIMNVFLLVQWNKYFHSVKDEMHHS